jgi:ABC-type branched-subunit amino acid transport system substrate-binding protein
VKRWLSVVIIAFFYLALFIGVACKAEEAEEVKEVKFGWGLPLSGAAGALLGIPAKQALELANEWIGEFTVAGERYRWNLLIEDNMWTGAGGVATATKFIYEDGVKFMTQSGADAAGAAQTIVEESGVLMDTAAAPMEFFGPDEPHSIQISPTYLVDTPVLFKYVTTTYPEVKTIAIAMADSAFGHSVGEAAIDAAPYFGLDVVAVEWIPVGVTELYPLATKLVNINPDLIICDVVVLKSMRELGYKGRTAYISWGESYGEYIGYEYYQDAMIYQPNLYGVDLPHEVRAFFVELEERYGGEPTQDPYFMATTLFLLTKVLEKAGTVDDMDRILETMHTETFDTWIGPVHFGGEELIGVNNIMLWPAAIHEIREEEYTPVFEMSADEAYELAVEVYK